ncbi:hypothetical protein [Eikenella exigua]|uniref:Transcriptional regulator n=1 Tax=Eikenella exigua TaxID=2528037 RepID=A0AAX1F6W3_9NEIS|nr:hypothetical protein [Eikenella exigua]QED91843.1 hypothetical protein EZJ17_03760 [Eikenella exigua]
MSWMDKDLQKQILLILQNSYLEPISIPELVKEIWPDEASINVTTEKLLQNIKYLYDHSLISSKDINSTVPIYALVEITPKGIDYLEPDGGLSASLGVITVKLHSDTIQQLLADKIEQANLPNEDKNKLIKTISGKFGDAFLAKLAEKAIEQIPAATVVTFIQSIIN